MLKTALAAARAAGRVLLEGSRGEIVVDGRPAHDVKLVMDKRAEAAIVEILREAFPEHAILAEESGRTTAAAEYEWVVDPLDGTYNYFRHIPAWSTSIGLRRKGEEILGVVYDPQRDEMFHATAGGGAFLNDRPIRVSETALLKEAIVATGYAARGSTMAHAAEVARRVTLASDKVRVLGSAALHLAYVACGRLDGFYEYHLWPWDIAAGVVLVREAGGAVAMRGHDDDSVDVVCSNGCVQGELEGYVLGA